MFNAFNKSNEFGVDPRWIIAVIVLTVLGISWTAQARDLSGLHNAHQFMTGPVGAKPEEPEGVDKHAIAQAVWSVLKYDHSKLTFEEVQPVVYTIVRDAEAAGIDPFIATTIVFLESRYNVDVIGDGGRACGMGQQHAKFSMKWGLSNTMAQFKEIRNKKKQFWLRHKYECELLKNPSYASRVMVYHLRTIQKRAKSLDRYVWWYNGRETYLDKHSYWRGATEDVYGRIMKKKAEEAQAKKEAETKGSLARNP